MGDEGMERLIAKAEAGAYGHLSFLKRTIKYDLYFTSFLFLINLINFEAIFLGYPDIRRFSSITTWMPPPILFLSLSASVIYLYRQLGKLKTALKDLASLTRTSGDSTPVKSLTDINYEVVEAMERSLRIWPFIGALFLVFIVSCTVSLGVWATGGMPDQHINLINVLNLATFVLITLYFFVKTKSWLAKRKQLKDLAEMERTVKEELGI